MCLHNRMPKKKQKEFISKITRKGLKVYKAVEVKDNRYYSPYLYQSMPYVGTMVAKQEIIHDKIRGDYTSGFHFFKSKAAAQRLCNTGVGHATRKFEVIECIIKKSWITEIGHEFGFDYAGYATNKLEVIIVAKKAIFPERRTICA